MFENQQKHLHYILLLIKNGLLALLLAAGGCGSTEPNQINFYGSFKPGGILFAEGNNLKKVFLDGKELILADNTFVSGFDRDAAGSRKLEIIYKDGSREEKEITISQRDYPIQRVTGLPKNFMNPSEAELKKVRRSRKLFAKALRKAAATKKPYYKTGFVRPVKGGRISGKFGGQRILNGVPGAPHNGLDISLPAGTTVYAMSDGIVELTGEFFYGGKIILLNHGQGLVSIYLHLDSIAVKPGRKVKKGQNIGEVGMTGRATGPHLHWGVQWKEKRIDPALLLDSGFGERSQYMLQIKVSEQMLYLYEDSKLLKSYPVSTAKKGVGSVNNSYKTPPGLHRVKEMVGDGAPIGTRFRWMRTQGEIIPIYRDDRKSDDDYILTRIMRLEGLQPGKNKGPGIDSYDRHIYIHGTQEEGYIGRPASKGCVRMKNRDIAELYNIVNTGTLVEIIP
ncbi:MAG: peptidoglycan DD-metalloendopeptidase family protein [Elusimicrobiota bacterium]|nr:peptidoglycan DD-metalloendopeptidase family protein [Elusimicrobiota bacterium]